MFHIAIYRFLLPLILCSNPHNLDTLPEALQRFIATLEASGPDSGIQAPDSILMNARRIMRSAKEVWAGFADNQLYCKNNKKLKTVNQKF